MTLFGCFRGCFGGTLRQRDTATREPWRRPVYLHRLGALVALLHLAAAIVYFYFRIRTTLTGSALDNPNYARLVLAVELLSAFSMILFSINLLCRTNLKAMSEPPNLPPNRFQHLRVHFLIVTYDEDFLEIVKATMNHALNVFPIGGCQCRVYLCDDQREPADWEALRAGREAPTPIIDNSYVKKFFHQHVRNPYDRHIERFNRPAHENGPHANEIMYVATRNGKSSNVNFALDMLNGRGHLTQNDIIVILDSDQQVEPNFLTATLQYFSAHEDIAMVITPQRFTPTAKPNADVLNHINADYWDLLLPGLDGLGFTSCPGTNFLVRGAAVVQTRSLLGRKTWIPEYTLTEDYALGMDMKAAGFHSVYVNKNLTFGKPPIRVVDSFRQRHRWAMGHFQIFLSKFNPLCQRGLSLGMRVLYASSVYTYLVSVLATLTLTAIPLINLWLGWFPLQINEPFIISFVVYLFSGLCLKYGTALISDVPSVKAMWFASCANSLFCMTYLNAAISAFALRASFGVTPKDLGDYSCWSFITSSWETFFRVLFLYIFFFAFSVFTLFVAAVKMIRGVSGQATVSPFQTPVVLCMAWVAYNILPALLLLVWASLHQYAYATEAQRRSQHQQRLIRAGLAMRPNSWRRLHGHPEGLLSGPQAEQATRAEMAKVTQTRINMDRAAEGLLVFLCTLVQCLGALLMLGIFALTFVAVFRSDDLNDAHPGVQTWCGLFPFYFTDTVGINRARWFDYPDCTPVKPFVRVN